MYIRSEAKSQDSIWQEIKIADIWHWWEKLPMSRKYLSWVLLNANIKIHCQMDKQITYYYEKLEIKFCFLKKYSFSTDQKLSNGLKFSQPKRAKSIERKKKREKRFSDPLTFACPVTKYLNNLLNDINWPSHRAVHKILISHSVHVVHNMNIQNTDQNFSFL